jgi:hypothetical protein
LSAPETGQDAATATGLVLIQGGLSATESGSDSASFVSGALPANVGAMAATEAGQDVASAIGLVLIKGGLSASETGADSASFAGDGASPAITGTIAASEAGSDSATALGLVLIQGGLSASEGADAAAFGGGVLVSGGFAAVESGSDQVNGASSEKRRATAGTVLLETHRPPSLSISRPANVSRAVRRASVSRSR